jgi:hypothetical protein
VESQCLQREESETSEKLARFHREAVEALAKLERFRKQRASLVTRGAIMVARGFQSLDELDEQECAESILMAEAQAVGAADVIDWNALELGFVTLTSLAGILLTYPDSSSGS